ncbi:MAG: hypothetical protein LC624_11770, partial [Halobacteriales archaeon]|nr:hypothetical protein [Halobacteriales archaeon]
MRKVQRPGREPAIEHGGRVGEPGEARRGQAAERVLHLLQGGRRDQAVRDREAQAVGVQPRDGHAIGQARRDLVGQRRHVGELQPVREHLCVEEHVELAEVAPEQAGQAQPFDAAHVDAQQRLGVRRDVRRGPARGERDLQGLREGRVPVPVVHAHGQDAAVGADLGAGRGRGAQRRRQGERERDVVARWRGHGVGQLRRRADVERAQERGLVQGHAALREQLRQVEDDARREREVDGRMPRVGPGPRLERGGVDEHVAHGDLRAREQAGEPFLQFLLERALEQARVHAALAVAERLLVARAHVLRRLHPPAEQDLVHVERTCHVGHAQAA